MKTVFIYALVDPRNETVRYIGKSKDPKQRRRRHIIRARNGVDTHCYNWIRVLLSENLKPDLLVIEEVPESKWEESEKKWIAYYREEVDLTNTADGGNAPPIYQHTKQSRKRVGDFFRGKTLSDEHRLRISEGKRRMPHPFRGKKLSDEHKRKMSESLKGRKLSDKEREAISERMTGEGNPNYGKEFSKEYRQKLSEAQKGRKHSEETKAKMRESAKRRNKNPEYIKKLSEAAKKRGRKNQS